MAHDETGRPEEFAGPKANNNRPTAPERSRREFLTAIAALGASASLFRGLLLAENPVHAVTGKPKTFQIWVFSDAHVGRDKKYGPRESLAEGHPPIGVVGWI
jgi:hypothetical protein